MSLPLRIAADEWRLWSRSRLALVGLGVFALLLTVTSVLSALRMESERQDRLAQQTLAEERYRAQPARHPHRMVHYGHYVFRTPPPLALFDPGVDAVTGQSLFLEGHRQNADMFADARAVPDTGGFGRLDPATVYQIFVPLLLIALGHASILREREAGTLGSLLAQGLSGTSLFLGKFAALATLALVMLLPAAGLVAVAVMQGEAFVVAAGILGLYAAYLLTWSALTMVVSQFAAQRGLALGVLLLVWLGWTLMLPRAAVSYAEAAQPIAGKLHSDLTMLAEQRGLSDGHNANDPVFAALRDGLLAEHGVERVEELPVNFRGVVAGFAEAKLTAVLNDYADQRMRQERDQLARLARFGWLSPALATGVASRTLSGTGLLAHQRFLREAEALRFEFVQGLNDAHARHITFADDAARSSDPEANQRTRISPENWQKLGDFRFTADSYAVRSGAAFPQAAPVLAWLFALVLLGFGAARRLQP